MIGIIKMKPKRLYFYLSWNFNSKNGMVIVFNILFIYTTVIYRYYGK